MSEFYFGKEEAEKYGERISLCLAGKTVSKRKDTAEEPGGLIYEANRLNMDKFDLLEALEGMCHEGRAEEIDDSTYRVNGEHEPITAKHWILSNWKDYNLVDSLYEMVELLNILQACDENLDSLHDVCCNGYDEFADIIGKWDCDREVVKSLKQFNEFMQEDDFIDYMLERIADMREEGLDPAEEIHSWTYEGEATDTRVERTEDGYVLRVWY